MGEIVDAQKYLKMAIVGVMSIVVLVVGYGIYINAASRRHIEKMEAARYTVLPVAYWLMMSGTTKKRLASETLEQE